MTNREKAQAIMLNRRAIGTPNATASVIKEITEALDSATQEKQTLVEEGAQIVKFFEWSVLGARHSEKWCARCGGYAFSGHAPNCPIKLFLDKVSEGEKTTT